MDSKSSSKKQKVSDIFVDGKLIEDLRNQGYKLQWIKEDDSTVTKELIFISDVNISMDGISNNDIFKQINNQEKMQIKKSASQTSIKLKKMEMQDGSMKIFDRA